MWIRSLQIDRAYGCDFDLALVDLCPGVNVVCAPNETGKSTICSAVRELLFTSARKDLRASAEVHIDGEDDHWSLLDGHAVWDEGRAMLASGELAACYTLTIDELGSAQSTDGSIQRAIEKELSGGFDVSRALASVKPQRASAPPEIVDAVDSAHERRKQAFAAEKSLRDFDQRASELETARRLGERATARLARISDCEKRIEKCDGLAVIQAQMSHLPSVCAHLQTGDARSLEDWEHQIINGKEKIQSANAEIVKWQARGEEAGIVDTAPGPDELEIARQRIDQAREAQRTVDGARKTCNEARSRLEAECKRIGWSLDPDHDEALDRETVKQLSLLLKEGGEIAPKRGVFDGLGWIMVLAASLLVGVLIGVFSWSIPYGVIAALCGVLVGLVVLQQRAGRVEGDLDPLAVEQVAESLAARGLGGPALRSALEVGDVLQGLDRIATDFSEYRAQQDVGQKAVEERDRLIQQISSLCGLETAELTETEVAFQDLVRRVQAHEEAQERCKRSIADRSEAEETVKSAQQRIAELCTRAGVETEELHDVKKGLERLADWKELDQKRVEITGAIEGMEVSIRAEYDDLLDLDSEGLVLYEKEKRVEKEAGDAAALELGELEGKLRAALESADVANAEAEFVGASDVLKAARSTHVMSVLRSFLLERARDACAVEAVDNGVISRRMGELFRRSTNGRYEVTGVRSTEESESMQFVVHDTQGAPDEIKPLSKLSTGPRAQLLLCARVAFLESQEHGDPRPIVLDDALGHSDPARFDATLQLLLELVAEGRQVIYLTDEPGHAQRWVNAAKKRGIQCVESQLGSAQKHALLDVMVNEIEPPPAPRADETAVAYAARLGVHVPRTWDPPERLHVVFLLHDDLDLAHRLLEEHVETLGQTPRFLSGQAASGLSEAERSHLAERIEMARAVVETSSIGHGRPWNEGDLDAAGDLVTKTMREKFENFARENGNNGERLLRASEANEGGLKNIQKKKLRDLADHFRVRGVIDPDEPRSIDAVVRDVRARVRLRDHDADEVSQFAALLAAISISSSARV